jgi:hypothetical protein
MSHILSCKLFADLALSAKTSKILSGLIVNYNQPQIISKTIPIATMTSQAFLAEQGLYVSSFIHQIMHSNSDPTINVYLKPLYFGSTNHEHERTFVHIRSQSNSKKPSLDNRSEWGKLLITQLANSNLETDLANWIIWTDDRGYLYFQPTPKGLSTWLKMLFDRTCMADQDSEFSLATNSDSLLHYIELRCNQMWKLAEPQVSPWIQWELNCTQSAELELIYGIIQVYDSLYMGAKYKIVAAGKSLGEKFLEFDRTCRLLDLDPNSPAFHERAGLIAIVRSAVRDLLASPTIIDRP